MEMTEEIQSEEIVSKGKNRGRLPAASKTENKQLKISCVIPDEHPFAKFCEEIKIRGIKGFSANDFIIEALEQVSEDFWQEKLEQLTPLEFRINAALADPSMREKLAQLLIRNGGSTTDELQ